MGATPSPITAKTFELGSEFKTPWQVAWIADGTEDGGIAFTDRAGNQIGLLDPATGRTQAIPLKVVTSPNPIVVIDRNLFAVAGTGGVAIVDRSGSGTVRELQMAGTRNTALAIGPQDALFVLDAQASDLRIIRPPYSGPADITTRRLPAQCLAPSGVVPDTTNVSVLCGHTNIVADLALSDFRVLRTTPLPGQNAGAQEPRPSPSGFVFSGLATNQVYSYSRRDNKFTGSSLTGPAVPTVGYFDDPAWLQRIEEAAVALASGKKPPGNPSFDSVTPSNRTGDVSVASFPAGTSRTFTGLRGRNLLGSTIGPGGSVFLADATTGRPAIHRLTFTDPKAAKTRTGGYRYASVRLTHASPSLLARMTMPFFTTGKEPPPAEVQVGITGASSSPWNLQPMFSDNFNLKVTARARLRNGRTYPVKVQSADTGAYTRVYRFFAFRPGTRNLTLTFTGRGEIPATFRVDAVAAAAPCECESLDVALRNITPEGSPLAVFRFAWKLDCTGGAGTCEGRFSITGDKAARSAGVRLLFAEDSDLVEFDLARNGIEVTCAGPCKGPTRGSRRASLGVAPPKGKTLAGDVKSVTIVARRTCGRALAPKIFEIAFGGDRIVDERRSDLNGNGVPDGNEKK